jgi:hypothetical protein
VRLVIRGHDLPGAWYAGHARIGVGLQVRSEPGLLAEAEGTGEPDVGDQRPPRVDPPAVRWRVGEH